MAEELKDSGTVTALSVTGFVFGLIGMLGSFIPCIGSLAFYIGIPAAIISGIALGIAVSQNAKRSFAIVAVTISLIGVIISGWQYFGIIATGKKAKEELEKMTRPPANPAPPANNLQTERGGPNQSQPQINTGPQVSYLKNEKGQDNSETARKLFVTSYHKLFHNKNFNELSRLKNNNDWVKKEIRLIKGAENFLKIEGPNNAPYLLFYNKNKVPVMADSHDYKCEGHFITIQSSGSEVYLWDDDGENQGKGLCAQFRFAPYYTDEKIELLLPAPYATDYKISLKDAALLN